MPSPIYCVICDEEIAIEEVHAGAVVLDDEGFHHRECAGGDSPTRTASGEEFAVAAREGDWTASQIEEENEIRRDHGDPPLTLSNEQRARFEFSRRRVVLDDYLPPGATTYGISEEGIAENDCPECEREPSFNGGRGFLCRGRSMI